MPGQRGGCRKAPRTQNTLRPPVPSLQTVDGKSKQAAETAVFTPFPLGLLAKRRQVVWLTLLGRDVTWGHLGCTVVAQEEGPSGDTVLEARCAGRWPAHSAE